MYKFAQKRKPAKRKARKMNLSWKWNIMITIYKKKMPTVMWAGSDCRIQAVKMSYLFLSAAHSTDECAANIFICSAQRRRVRCKYFFCSAHPRRVRCIHFFLQPTTHSADEWTIERVVAPCSSSAALRSASLASALGRAAYVLIVCRVHSREKTKILSYIFDILH